MCVDMIKTQGSQGQGKVEMTKWLLRLVDAADNLDVS